MTSISFTNFTKGEIAPELQARIDTQQYASAAKIVRNFIIQRYGGLSFRPGFRFVGEVDNVAHDIKYMPFQFNMEQSYIMAVQDTSMRLLTGGGFVLEVDNNITAITKEYQGIVTAALHGYVVGQRIYFSGIVGMTELNGRIATVTEVFSANTFRMSINTTNYGTFVSSTGAVAAVPPVVPAVPALPPAPPAAPAPPATTVSSGTGGNVGGTNTRSDYDGLQRTGGVQQ